MNEQITSLDVYQKEALRTAPRNLDAYKIPASIEEAVREHVGDGDGEVIKAWEPMLARYDQMIWALGLAGETGEFIDIIKKVHGHGHEFDETTRLKAAKELGDVLWYLSACAHSIGFSLSTVATMNITKLRERYKSGFTIEESKKRDQ